MAGRIAGLPASTSLEASQLVRVRIFTPGFPNHLSILAKGSPVAGHEIRALDQDFLAASRAEGPVERLGHQWVWPESLELGRDRRDHGPRCPTNMSRSRA